MDLFSKMSELGFEQVVYGHERATGLRAIIAIHDTTLGPAVGGTRMYPYESDQEALTDVLRLARGMTYKAAAAGLNLGGGKAVIIGDPKRDKNEGLLRAYGRLVQSLGGRYITGPDVGTNTTDMDIIRQETSYVAGCSEVCGGGGDTSILTSLAVYMSMAAAANVAFGSDSLTGRVVVIQGVGKVGRYLVERLAKDGARLFVADVDAGRARAVAEQYRAQLVGIDEVYDVECDFFSPNAMGAILNEHTIPRLRCRVVVGGANNQLATPADAERLLARGILYAPDYVANCGGVIHGADELAGYNHQRAEAKVREVYGTMQHILSTAAERGMPTDRVADAMAEERICRIGDIHRSYLRH